MEDKLITLREAAALSGLSRSHLALLSRTGQLKAQKLGPLWLTTERAVTAYLKHTHRGPYRRKDE